MNPANEGPEYRKQLAAHCRELHQAVEALEKVAKRSISLGNNPDGTLQTLAEIRASLTAHRDTDALFAAVDKRARLAMHRIKAHWLRRTGRTNALKLKQ